MSDIKLCDEYCDDCIHLGYFHLNFRHLTKSKEKTGKYTPYCAYMINKGMSRPCKAGTGCIVKEKTTMTRREMNLEKMRKFRIKNY